MLYQYMKNLYRNNNIVYVLEGLPGGGKTTIFNHFSKNRNFNVVEQIIHHNFYHKAKENYYFYSDYLKYKKAEILSRKKVVLMDRGYMSTLAYNYAYNKIFKSNNYIRAKKEIKKNSAIFSIPCMLLYIAINTKTSLRRKNRMNKQSIWRNEKFLSFMKDFYEKEMPKLNKNNKIININGELLLSQVIDHVKKITTS